MATLIEVSPTISPEVKTEARKLAVSWKANLSSRTEKSGEVCAFLLFLVAYRLRHFIGQEDILQLVLVAADQRHAPYICRSLGYTDKIPGMFFLTNDS